MSIRRIHAIKWVVYTYIKELAERRGWRNVFQYCDKKRWS